MVSPGHKLNSVAELGFELDLPGPNKIYEFYNYKSERQKKRSKERSPEAIQREGLIDWLDLNGMEEMEKVHVAHVLWYMSWSHLSGWLWGLRILSLLNWLVWSSCPSISPQAFTSQTKVRVFWVKPLPGTQAVKLESLHVLLLDWFSLSSLRATHPFFSQML